MKNNIYKWNILLSSLENIFCPKDFNGNKCIMLNPILGILDYGITADADIIIEDKLIDIKISKKSDITYNFY